MKEILPSLFVIMASGLVLGFMLGVFHDWLTKS